MEHDLCLICGQPINLFSKDPYTDSICFACFQNQSAEWRESVEKNKNNPALIQELLDRILPLKSASESPEPAVPPADQPETKHQPTAQASALPEPEPTGDGEEKLKRGAKKASRSKTRDSVPEWADDFYYQPGMDDHSIRSLIDHRVFILNKMKYFAQVEKIEENYQMVLLDMIRHQLEVIINQNELLLRALTKNPQVKNQDGE